MNGIFFVISKFFPFVTSINSVQALSSSKDSEKVFQQPAKARPGALFLLSWLTLVPAHLFGGHGVEDAIDTIPAERVKRLLDSGGKLVLVDLRPGKDFQEKRLPGARSIPSAELAKRFEEIPKVGQVVLYCACTINEIADQAAFLVFRGYRNVFVMPEGYPGWVKRGYPLETGRR